MKILVIHATAGAGHKKAAEAVYNGLKAAGHNARLVDALDYTNPFFKKSYPGAYTFFVTKISWAWGFCFEALSWNWLQPLVRLARRLYNGFNAGALQKFMVDEQFDVIITTQFLSAEVSAYLKRTGKIKSRIVCVVTDFDVHPIWINEGIDIYTGATDFTKGQLERLGVPANRAFVTGIPTDEAFTRPQDVAALKQQLGVQDNIFTVLLATGSFGMGPIEELIDRLAGVQVVVVCGHNKQLFERLKNKSAAHARVFGLVNNMHELMSVSNAMVTKPGGLSIAEALVKGLPMVFFSAIPGQETNNIAVLKKYGAAEDQMPVEAIAEKINSWKNSPQEFERVRQNLGVLAKPNAVKDIIKLVS